MNRKRSRRLDRGEVEEREEALRGLCFCLLYDLCAWLADARHPIPPEVREYRLGAVRQLTDARDRLGRYLNPSLLDLWEEALSPFFESGASLSLELGEAAPLGAEGLEEEGVQVRAELRFSERSSVIDARGRGHPLPRRDWLLEAWVSPDLNLVENAWLRPA